MSKQKRSIFLAGDSTVRDYEMHQYPQAGWGEFLADYFTDDIEIRNHAAGGRSSKTFILEGRLTQILQEIKEGDYLFIQMGHNDSTKDRPERYTDPDTDYKEYLRQYIDGARSKNALPILFTPVGRLNYVQGTFHTDFPAYCKAVQQLGKEKDVPVIDLMQKSVDHFASKDYEIVKNYFMISVNGTDCTHFTKEGAKAIARLVGEEIAESAIDLSKYVLI